MTSVVGSRVAVGGNVAVTVGRGAAVAVAVAGSVGVAVGKTRAVATGVGVLVTVGLASDISEMHGGKRYLSGLIHFDRDKWRAHYGPLWADVDRLKKKYDPKGVLNPGFVKYEE